MPAEQLPEVVPVAGLAWSGDHDTGQLTIPLLGGARMDDQRPTGERGAVDVAEGATSLSPPTHPRTRRADADDAPELTALLSLTDDGVLLVDRGGRIVRHNHAAARCLGLLEPDRNVRLADAIARARPRDSLGRHLSADALLRVATAHPLGVRVRLQAPRQAARWVRVSSATVAPGSTLLLLRDVTGLVATEESSHRFRRTLDLALDAVYLLEPRSLRVAYANDGAVRQSGLSRDELEAGSLIDVLPLLDATAVEAAAGQADGRGPLALPAVSTVLRTRGGALVPVDVLLQALDLGDDERPILAVVRDASERVEAQARLQRLVQQERARAAELEAMLAAIGDAVVVCSSDGQVTLANPASRDVLRGSRLQTYADLLECFEDPEGAAPRLGALTRQGPVELRVRGRAEGWVELSAYPVFAAPDLGGDSDAEQVSATIFVARDVTAAREVVRAREAFLGVLSHELRTPVTTILGGAKVLRRRERLSTATRRELYKDIEAESERLYRLVEDLLVLARFEDRGFDGLADEPLLLQRMLPGLLASEEVRWPGRHFELRVPQGLSTVRGDRTYLEQVVRNLLGNAAKYAGEDGTIETRVRAAGDEVEVRIMDRGPGFPATEAERLFELYYRSPGTVGVASGAGIGLFVCRRLVEAMGGRIWAHPRRGGGAEFGFALRVLTEEEA